MYSKGITWIDDCRIPFVDEGDKGSAKPQGKTTIIRNVLFNPTNDMVRSELETTQGQGRFPANILVSDDMLNDGKKHGNLFNTNRNKDVDGGTGNSLVRAHKQGESNGVFDNGISSSRFYDIDKWFNNLIDG
jgi:hypothetical protein